MVHFIEQVHFDTRVKNQVILLEPEPLCKDLIERTNSFNKSAYEQKKAVTGGEVKIPFEIEFSRGDYDKRRDDALLFLKGVLKTFEDELNRITPLLQQKAESDSN
ncbi:MAG: hypothetical protein M3Z96_13950 [Pseudomonadota bacterium]|nr:hypothetical protein [Pseudomonadota bacterium]